MKANKIELGRGFWVLSIYASWIDHRGFHNSTKHIPKYHTFGSRPNPQFRSSFVCSLEGDPIHFDSYEEASKEAINLNLLASIMES